MHLHRDNLLTALQDLLTALESLHTTLALVLRVEETSAVLWDVRDTPMRPYTSFVKVFQAYCWGVKLQGGPDPEEDEEVRALLTAITDELRMREDAIQGCNKLLSVLQSHR